MGVQRESSLKNYVLQQFGVLPACSGTLSLAGLGSLQGINHGIDGAFEYGQVINY